jgi:guanylate kinase
VPPRPVFVVTGTSGAGKGTIERQLLARMPELELAISATTRERRDGEEDGREYWFISQDDFDAKLAAGEFLEHIVFDWGQRSGTLRSEIDRILDAGRIPLLDLETEGALRLTRTRSVPGAVTIFVKAPSFEENERRLRERATESEGEIEERLELARRQLEQEHLFDYVISNDDLDRAVAELEEIVRGALADAGTVSRP